MTDGAHGSPKFALDPACRAYRDGGRLVLVTPESATVLSGTATAAVIARGLALLDGSRTQHEIAHELRVCPQDWDRVVDRLSAAGLAMHVDDAATRASGLADLVTTMVGRRPAETATPETSRLALCGDATAFLDAFSDAWAASGGWRASLARRLSSGTPSTSSSPTRALASRRAYTRGLRLPVASPLATSLSATVEQRRSSSPPGAGGVNVHELSSLLALAYGVTRAPDDPRGWLRPVPSGGAMYPLDLYLGIGRCVGVESGLYHYDPFRHGLEQLGGEAMWHELAMLGATPSVQLDTSVALLVVACFARQTSKYGVRGYRLAYLEAGHVGQNAVLAATSLGLRSLPYASFYDASVERLLDLDGVNESLVHAVLVGRA